MVMGTDKGEVGTAPTRCVPSDGPPFFPSPNTQMKRANEMILKGFLTLQCIIYL